MWFLLSLNLSHWIGSFSTVGLDTHLGFSQKGLREANHFHFSFSGEGEWAEREEREKGTIFQAAVQYGLKGTDFELKQGTENKVGSFIEAVLCMNFEAVHRQYSTEIEVRTVCTDSTFLHRFRGGYQAHFPRQLLYLLAQKSRPYCSIKCCPYSTDSESAGTVFEGRFFLLIFPGTFFKEVCTEIEAAKARKLRQTAGQISGLR